MKTLEEIWHQVPPNYYQKGVSENFLQKLWHTNKLNIVSRAVSKEIQNPKNILDVGCASGWFLDQISKEFPKAKCVGIDIYKNAIVYGRKKYKHLNLVYGDGHRLPFKSNSFDVVICTEVLEHVENPDIVISQIRRVLKKNGVGVVEMDSGNLLFKTIWFWWTNIKKGIWQDAHIQSFNLNKLENVLKRNGLKIINKKIFNFSMAVAFTVNKSSLGFK